MASRLRLIICLRVEQLVRPGLGGLEVIVNVLEVIGIVPTSTRGT